MAVLDPVRVVIDNTRKDRPKPWKSRIIRKTKRPERGWFLSLVNYISNGMILWRMLRKKFFRMTLGNEVRLKGAYIVKCESVEKDAEGNITTIHCTYDADTRSGTGSASNRKVKGTLHWVSARTLSRRKCVCMIDCLKIRTLPDIKMWISRNS